VSDSVTGPDLVRVDLGGRGYDIAIGLDLIADAGRYLSPALGKRRRVVIISDENVAAHYLSPLARALDAAGIAHESLIVSPGEGSKAWPTLTSLIDRLMALRVDRKTVILALGGGVVGDLAGFVAAITLRGLDFVQIPTSLLAQVDSSVGGKTGINVPAGKNLVGAFHQPILVLTDLGTLNTLPARERRAGYAEIVKHAAIGDAAFFPWLEANGAALIAGDPAARARAIRHSCETKAAIVAADEFEADRRALLNFGHTFGHAFEAETGFGEALVHGEAVAVGMALAATFSVRLGLCPAEARDRLIAHLDAVGLPTRMDQVPGGPFSPDILLDHMAHDKKAEGGRLTFVLLRDLGDAFIARSVELGPVREMLSELQR
jgi:3-dehydroquinate synthase